MVGIQLDNHVSAKASIPDLGRAAAFNAWGPGMHASLARGVQICNERRLDVLASSP
jgi:hypothetical protein